MTGAGIVVVLAASAFFGWLYFRARAGNSSVPAGEIVSQDTENLEILEPILEPLVSHSLRGSGANCEVAQIRTVPLHRSDSDIDHAACAARQISGSVARRPPSWPNLNCHFLIFSASSIPLITISAALKFFSPSIGRNRCLILR